MIMMSSTVSTAMQHADDDGMHQDKMTTTTTATAIKTENNKDSDSAVRTVFVKDVLVHIVGSVHLLRCTPSSSSTSSIPIPEEEETSQIQRLIREVRPYMVCMELCPARRDTLYRHKYRSNHHLQKNHQRHTDLSLLQIVQQCMNDSAGSLRVTIVRTLLTVLVQRIAHILSIDEFGAEFSDAYEAAKSVGSKVVLCD